MGVAVGSEDRFGAIGYGREALAPFATRATESRGRLQPEPASPTRTPFQRDRDRIVHSTAFRRLAHKTQVFVHHEGDHFRSRLTHTIEVAQIARAIARALRLDEDLTEALALAHDLGHTPYGHTGEDALHAVMEPYGGFDHNAQTLRIVTRLEHRYAAFDGLNLSLEALDGLVKHNGPLTDAQGVPTGRYEGRGLPHAFLDFAGLSALDLSTQPGLEAQAAAISDDIAYNAHDIDDGLRAGHIALPPLLEAVPFLKRQIEEIDRIHPGLDPDRRIAELVRRLITAMVEDVLAEATRRLDAVRPQSLNDVAQASRPLIAFSAEMAETDRQIKGYLFPALYRHPRVVKIRTEAARVVTDLFALYMQRPQEMPEVWQKGVSHDDPQRLARRVCDYIAGMTDRYALIEHRRLFDDSPSLR
ncbi:MAG: deoxyguanosinetriphosphate triphosphohydrolase [Hyphomicrobiaceae bacterium]|nr:deoxyguanosinetriphosphate triphosphohydrolase [Hyphomicrobiaceae bacterium]